MRHCRILENISRLKKGSSLSHVLFLKPERSEEEVSSLQFFYISDTLTAVSLFMGEAAIFGLKLPRRYVVPSFISTSKAA